MRTMMICTECPRGQEFIDGFHPVFEMTNPNVVSYMKFEGIHRLPTGVCNGCKIRIQNQRIVGFNPINGRHILAERKCETQG